MNSNVNKPECIGIIISKVDAKFKCKSCIFFNLKIHYNHFKIAVTFYLLATADFEQVH